MTGDGLILHQQADSSVRCRNRIGSVGKASRILQTFGPDAPVLTLREIALRTGLPRSTCHLLCATLVGEELLELRSGGGYRLGPGLAQLGAQVIERAGLVEAATPAMLGLSREVPGEVHLGQFASGWILYLTRVEYERRLPMRNWMGMRVPAHITGCGKAALSRLDAERVEELVGRHADVDLPELLDELEQARTAGYVVSDSFQPGIVSVAAPLLAGDGSVAGGLSVARPRALLDKRRAAEVGLVVRAAAQRASLLLMMGPRRKAARRHEAQPYAVSTG